SDFTALGANLNLQSKVIDNMIKKTVSVQEIFFKTPALNLLSQKRQEELQALVKERCARLGKGI
ncbi:MAG TPA: hypothetical protein PLU33_10060, partial [Treponemataceae bacterium]|nr:hypothetical protein [Treponemataceae bacterium]